MRSHVKNKIQNVLWHVSLREEVIHVGEQTNHLESRNLPLSSVKYHLGTRGACQNANLFIQVVYSQIQYVSQIGPYAADSFFLTTEHIPAIATLKFSGGRNPDAAVPLRHVCRRCSRGD